MMNYNTPNIDKLNDYEYDRLCELFEHAMDRYTGKNETTAFKSCMTFCKRHNISAEEFWIWVDC